MKKIRIIPLICLTLAAGMTAYSATQDAADEAFSLYREGKLEQAREKAVHLMNESLALSDTCSYIKALCLQADIATDTGNDGDAALLYDRCMEFCGYSEPMFTLSSSLYNIALIYYSSKDYEEALKYAVRSIKIDSIRESDSVLALRYLLVARILYEMGEYPRALEYIARGEEYSVSRKNNNVSGRLVFLETLCHEALSADNPDWEALERGYLSAYDLITSRADGFYYGGVNPYLPEVCYHLGLVQLAQGKDSKPFFEKAVGMVSSPQKMRGKDLVTALLSSRALADILEQEGDLEKSAEYSRRASSLSYVPFLNEMMTKVSLSQIEFLKREKDFEIERERNRTMTMIYVAVFFAVLVLLLSLMYRNQRRQSKEIEERNAQLVKLNLQKDNLVNMMREGSKTPGISQRVEEIAGDTVPLPDINLSKREKEIIELCCNGYISKEIAAKLGISVRTVESHKCNIFRKVGVRTTNELIAFAIKSGIVK